MTHPDYYAILGVAKTASTEEIKKAYKKLVARLHPDANPNDDEATRKFNEVNDAWGVLRDEKKRANYDKYGTPDEPLFRQDGQPGGGPQWTHSSGGTEVPFDLDDLFNRFRHGRGGTDYGGRQQQWPMRGHDIQTEVSIPFLLAARGGKTDFSFQRDASGAVETLTVTIPSGVNTGSVIRLAGQGTPGAHGGVDGDMLVSLNVQPHPWFRREGNDILLDVPLSLSEAALGVKVDVPTIHEDTLTLTIPEGTSSGTKLRLREKGIRDQRTGKTGDMYAVTKIVSPRPLTDRARELLEQLREAAPQTPRAQLWK